MFSPHRSLWLRRSLWAAMLLLMTAISATLGHSPTTDPTTPLSPTDGWPTRIAILSLFALGLLTLLLKRPRTP